MGSIHCGVMVCGDEDKMKDVHFARASEQFHLLLFQAPDSGTEDPISVCDFRPSPFLTSSCNPATQNLPFHSLVSALPKLHLLLPISRSGNQLLFEVPFSPDQKRSFA